MGKSSNVKKERHLQFLEKLNKDPFLTDDELADFFNVSIPTIRLDRLKLGIPELRERVKQVAEKTHEKVKAINKSEMMGELVDITLGQSGISILETTSDMTFERTKIIKGQYIYSQAESLAMAVIDAEVALVGVANIKYKVPVHAGAKLIAKAEVIKERLTNTIIWVKIFERQTEVFRGKFILVAIEI